MNDLRSLFRKYPMAVPAAIALLCVLLLSTEARESRGALSLCAHFLIFLSAMSITTCAVIWRMPGVCVIFAAITLTNFWVIPYTFSHDVWNAASWVLIACFAAAGLVVRPSPTPHQKSDND